MPRRERSAAALGVVLLVTLPTAVQGWPTTLGGNAATLAVLVAGMALLAWRSSPRAASVLALGLFLVAVAVGGSWEPPYPLIAIYSAGFVVLALGWSGRAAWLAGLCGAAYVLTFSDLSHTDSWVAAVILTAPPYAAGTVLRLRKETADQLALRAQELEDERELYAGIALRHERARIASELHDIVGHAISVMVIQAAAGQRLVDADPVRAEDALTAISESARQGTKDLERLVHLLGGSEEHDARGPDLSLVDEVVARACRSGLNVTCRVDGDHGGLPGLVASLAFRVVQESLTNALRYAPGADVRIVIRLDREGRDLAVRVENDRVALPDRRTGDELLAGTGRGLVGLRERIQTLGGQLSAGATGAGGWAVEARLPAG